MAARPAIYEEWMRPEDVCDRRREALDRAMLLDLVELLPCDYCGETGGWPVEVEDRDDSVGYHATEIMCTLCAPKNRRAA